jgi:amino acid adenylation domain-containing protein/non-ribosomal peptide synthase protein (TIGR01720 family)
MTAVELLSRLRALDITVALHGERLRVNAPEGALTDELRSALVACKAEVVALLRAPSAADAPIDRAPSGDRPLSFAQQRFWFLDQLVPGTAAYHIPVGVRFEGRLDRPSLERALDEIVRRHEVLRSVIVMADGRARQVVRPAGRMPLQVVDLTSVPAEERSARFEDAARAVLAAPFDLAVDIPVRAALIALGASEHALIVVVHHVATDGWSAGVLLRELGALYQAFAADLPSPLPELEIQYADFAAWQRARVEGDALDAQHRYWMSQLANLPTLELPTDRPRPAVQSLRGGRVPIVLPAPLVAALDSLSRRERATPFVTLLAAFFALLHRYTGQSDLVVGTAVAGRQRPEIEPLIGPCINSLVLRADAAGDPTFRTFLGRVREMALEAYANQDLPFERIVDQLRPERTVDRNPLFQVMLALQNVPFTAVQLPELQVRAIDLDRAAAVSDLELIFWPASAGLEGFARYSADLFDEPTVRRLLDRLLVLLDAAASDPDRRLSQLPLLTASDRQQLESWNDTPLEYDRDEPAHAAVARHAAATPGAPALVWRGRSMSYAELDAAADAIAESLTLAGAGRGDCIAICMERSPQFVAAALGALKAGAAYLPLDPHYPAERLAFMVSDSRARVVLADRSNAARVADCGSPVLCPGDEAPRGRSVSAANRVGAGDLAYVIYTSGSTGTPKGVALSHRGLMNLVAWHRHVYRVAPADRAALVAGLGFDASVWELWPYLAAGACVCIPDEETRASASLLLDWLAESAVTICFAPTPLAEAMIASDLPAGLRLRALLTGGDRLHAVPAGLPFALFNNYGPTENTVVSTWYALPAAGAAAAPPIGVPVTNTRAYVLDRGLSQVAPGLPGELYVAGESLARGYLGQPGLTAERFVPDPFSAAAGDRMYRTGDLVRQLADGNLEFIGRADGQVKIRGFRIELGEIETVLRGHPAVADAVVIAREHQSGSRRLLAYVVLDGPADTAGLRAFLAARLPDYMVPAVFTSMAALPVTANGKIDRAALPEPAPAAAGADAGSRAAATDIERILAGAWTAVLRLEHVGADDNFFEAGGDSILALQVIARARQHGVRLTPRQIFEHPTIAELSAVAGVEPAARAIDRPEGDAPLTPIQQWFLDQDAPEPWHFNQALMLAATERLEPARLERALDAVVDHHDALRLRFGREPGGWRQFHAPAGQRVPVERVDAADRESRAAVMQAAAARTQASLDLASGPLVRAVLFDCGAGEPQRLLIAIHHLVVDAVSWRILLEDLQQAYRDLAAERAPALPPRTHSFQTWARRLAEYAANGLDESRTRYWRGMPGGAPVPLDLPDGDNRAGSDRVVTLEVSAGDTESLLREVPRVYGMQIHEVLLTALARAAAGWTGAATVAVDLEAHGRDALFEDLDVSRTVGWFTTLYPIALDLSGADDPGEALKRVKEQARAVPDRGASYGLLRYLRRDAALDRQPRPAIGFNYLGQFDVEPAGALLVPAAESPGAIVSALMRRPHAIDVSALVAGGCLRVSLHYSDGLHRRATIERFGDSLAAALGELIAHCRAPEAGGFTPSDFPEANVTQDELDRLLARIGQAGSY